VPKSSKDSMTPMPLQGLHAPKVLSLLSSLTLRPLRDFVFLPFSLTNGEYIGCLPGYPSASSNLLLSFIRVLSNPVKILQWILPLNYQNSKSSLLLSVPVYTLTQMPTWQSVFSQNVQQFCPPPPVHLCTRSMPT
jgi:hypothetical protein